MLYHQQLLVPHLNWVIQLIAIATQIKQSGRVLEDGVGGLWFEPEWENFVFFCILPPGIPG